MFVICNATLFVAWSQQLQLLLTAACLVLWPSYLLAIIARARAHLMQEDVNDAALGQEQPASKACKQPKKPKQPKQPSKEAKLPRKGSKKESKQPVVQRNSIPAKVASTVSSASRYMVHGICKYIQVYLQPVLI